MTIKLIGAALVVAGCGGFGFAMAAAHHREEQTLGQLLLALEYMESDLSCHMTPLPQLCRTTANAVTGPVHTFLHHLAEELEAQVAPDAPCCVRAVVHRMPELGDETAAQLLELGNSLGQFDLPGQLRGLGNAQSRCRLALEALRQNRDSRLRSYQTLGLCAGAALAILFL